MTAQTGIRIGEAYYARIEDAMEACDCGHTVLANEAEEVWEGTHVKVVCDACFFAKD